MGWFGNVFGVIRNFLENMTFRKILFACCCSCLCMAKALLVKNGKCECCETYVGYIIVMDTSGLGRVGAIGEG